MLFYLVSGNKRTIILVEFDHYKGEINHSLTTEKGNTLEIQWKIGNVKDGYKQSYITTYVTEDRYPTSFWSRKTDNIEIAIHYPWIYIFGNRLKASYGGDLYKATVENVTYTDSTQYSIKGMFYKNDGTKEFFKSFVQVQVNGKP